jgi:hypothetical protein
MGDDLLLVIFAVLFPVLLLGEVVLLVLLWRSGGGRLPRIVGPAATHGPADRVANEVGLVSAWLISSGLAMAVGFVASFVAVHVLLFSFGTEIAMLGLILSAGFLIAIPIVVAVVIRRQAHR